ARSLRAASALADLPPLSLHDALPICSRDARARQHRIDFLATWRRRWRHREEDTDQRDLRAFRGRCEAHVDAAACTWVEDAAAGRSEEHTSELQSRENLVCRLLLEKKK